MSRILSVEEQGDIAVKIVSLHFNLTLRAITGPGRKQRNSDGRSWVCYLLRECTDLTFQECADVIKRSNHSTAFTMFHKVRSRSGSDFFKATVRLKAAYRSALTGAQTLAEAVELEK